MKYAFGIMLILVPFLHGIHVWMIDVGSIPSVNSARPLSWSSLDRIAASGDLGKGLILGFDILMIAAGIKLLLEGRHAKNASSRKHKRR